jgi:hypothetical protein
MEARATTSGTAVPKAFVAAVLVIVAMGMAAMSGYVARGVLNGSGAGAASTSNLDVHPAAGTVLRQDNPVRAQAELPSWLQQEIASKPATRIIVDDPSFWRQYLTAPPYGERPGGPRYI